MSKARPGATGAKIRGRERPIAAQPDSGSPDSALNDSMGYLVRRTFRSFTHVLEQRLAPHDITISMWFFLRLLWERDGDTQKEVGEELGLAPPTIAAAMDNMEARGLIRRERNQADRRRINIYLTQKGRDLKGDLIGYAREVNDIAVRDLHGAEVEMLRYLLLRVNGSLDQNSLRGGR